MTMSCFVANRAIAVISGIYLCIVAAFLALVPGWVTNIIWLIKQASLGVPTGLEVVVALVGVIMFPLGALHGIYLWF
jgi:hypothetical protein